MTKLTYAQQIKADRKAAAAERRQNDYRKDEFFTQAYSSMTTNTPKASTKIASVLRRIEGRLANLTTLGKGYNDAHLFLLEAVAANYTNDELLAKGRGQNSMLKKFNKQINEFFGLTPTVIEGMFDDNDVEKVNPFAVWYIDDADAPMVKEYISQLVANYKAA